MPLPILHMSKRRYSSFSPILLIFIISYSFTHLPFSRTTVSLAQPLKPKWYATAAPITPPPQITTRFFVGSVFDAYLLPLRSTDAEEIARFCEQMFDGDCGWYGWQYDVWVSSDLLQHLWWRWMDVGRKFRFKHPTALDVSRRIGLYRILYISDNIYMNVLINICRPGWPQLGKN